MQLNPVDVHVGNQIKQRRMMLGLKQGELGKHVGITFQQIQKYERGETRVAASRLHMFAVALKVPVSYFFEGFPLETETANKPQMKEEHFPQQTERLLSEEALFSKETIGLVRSYYHIKSVPLRKKILQLMQLLSTHTYTKDS